MPVISLHLPSHPLNARITILEAEKARLVAMLEHLLEVPLSRHPVIWEARTETEITSLLFQVKK